MKIVILAGGLGTRLWPLSRKERPKQFLKLDGDDSLLQKTVKRFYGAYGSEDLVLLTRDDLKPIVAKEVEAIDPKLKERIAIEPEARGTFPAIHYGLKWLEERGELADQVLFVPSDQLVSPEIAFLEAVERAGHLALDAPVVAFGIVPKGPHTGYGYIECFPSEEVSPIKRFIEKPPIEKAKQLLDKGNCLWNAGIFLIRTAPFLKDIENFEEIPPLSFDHGYMESCSSAMVVPLHLNWSDVGSWSSVYDALGQDNVMHGDVTGEGTTGSLLINEGRGSIVAIDLEDMVVVNTPDAVLVSKRSSQEKLKGVVSKLKKEVTTSYPTVERPWGSYTVLEEGQGYKVKRITVEPDGQLSLQYHHHRSEHWVVIKGQATVVLNDQIHALGPNDSLFIPKKAQHRLVNEGDEVLEIIETQTGDYVGEDDIVRLDDVYGRTELKASK